jgi:hypothetical protein
LGLVNYLFELLRLLLAAYGNIVVLLAARNGFGELMAHVLCLGLKRGIQVFKLQK